MTGILDATALALFLGSAFVGGLVTGLAGFAMGLVVSGVWLHILTPLQTTTLVVAFGLTLQSYSIWKMRKALNRQHVMPVIVGSVFGVPLGVYLLAFTNPAYLRLAVGLLLIAYGTHGLARPKLRIVPPSVPAEIVLGFFNGILGGMTGLSGVFVTIWCSMRGWSKDVQRAVYQPVLVASAILTSTGLVVTGAVTPDVVTLFLYGLPVQLAGMLVGMKLYGKLDDAGFRKIILVLLLLSGLVLTIPELLALR